MCAAPKPLPPEHTSVQRSSTFWTTATARWTMCWAFRHRSPGSSARCGPDAIFAPDPWLAYESHLDHVVTGRAAANAFLMSGRAAIPGGGDTQPHAASAIGYYFTAQPNTVVDISAVFEKKFEAIALHDSQMDAQTLAMYRVYFGMKGKELAAGKNFALGEGLKVLSPLHAHCFVDAARI